MIRTNNVGGFFIFLLTDALLWFGIIVVNIWGILYWFEEPNVDDRLISVLPTTHLGTVLFLAFNTLGYLSFISHLRASFWDPGVIPADLEPPEIMPKSEVVRCKKCSMNWKPRRAHHCSECNVCIFKMDHHWPWINSWVGIKNSKYFFLFTFYTGIGALLSIAILITSFVLLLQDDTDAHIHKPAYPIAFFLWIWVLIESILFSYFTLELVGEQLESFQDNQTYVDDLKDLFGVPLTLFESLYVWLGEDWQFWLLPTQPVLDINYTEKLFKASEFQLNKYENSQIIDFDPQGKLKEKSRREAATDKIYFAAVMCLSAATFYYLASVLL